jgi:hypothetical protein
MIIETGFLGRLNKTLVKQWHRSPSLLLPIQGLVRRLLNGYVVCQVYTHLIFLPSRLIQETYTQIFMTRRNLVTCFHEPFGDAFYFGPERISPAWLRWPADQIDKTGRAHYTYDYVLQTILDAIKVGQAILWFLSSLLTARNYYQEPSKRVFLKDMSYHIIPPSHSPNATAPSLQHLSNPRDPPNPTLLPTSLLNTFQFIFLIRRPSASMPSLYRCFIPPLSEKTGEHTLDPTELGYRETRLLFDYLSPPALRPAISATSIRSSHGVQDALPILIDADDLLAHPEFILRSVCARLNFPYSSSMLSWSTPEDHVHAESLFKKYAGYHEDALNSTGLRSRTADRQATGRDAKTRAEEDQEWTERYGSEAASEIRSAVDLCREDYEYLRGFRIKPEDGEDGDID